MMRVVAIYVTWVSTYLGCELSALEGLAVTRPQSKEHVIFTSLPTATTAM